MRAVRAADESQPTSVARRVSRFVLLPILAGIALYLTQGVPQYLGREGGTPPDETYWSDPWWILADVVYVATLSVAVYVRRERRISGDWAIFVALSAALTYTATGAIGAAIGYSYGQPAMAFFLMFGVNIAINYTFWIAFALGLICIVVVARLRKVRSRATKTA